MRRIPAWRWIVRLLGRRRRGLKSFEQELQAHGGLASSADIGTRIVPVEKVVGSVGRARALRSDFFYRRRVSVTQRYIRIGEAMEAGTILPPVDLYKLQRPTDDQGRRATSEYYVVDGHHRVAMARKLGQDFLDARVVEYRVANDPAGTSAQEVPEAPDDR